MYLDKMYPITLLKVMRLSHAAFSNGPILIEWKHNFLAIWQLGSNAGAREEFNILLVWRELIGVIQFERLNVTHRYLWCPLVKN